MAVVFAVSCTTPTDQQDGSTPAADAITEQTDNSITIPVTSLVDSSGSFATAESANGKSMLGSESAGQWLQFEVDVETPGRYRTEVIAVSTGEGESPGVWLEDYVGNPDGRTYNVTGSMPVTKAANTNNPAPTTRDGSPLNSGKHKMRLHFSDAGIHVQEINFTLMIPHQETPVTLTQDMSGDEWKVVWSDEFDGSGLPDTTKWTFDVGDWGWGNNELQYYTDKNLDNARVEDGNLVVEAHKNKAGNAWTSARLTTRGKQTFLYGKIEFRAKVPTRRGNWAAGWTLGDSYVDELSWPYCGEIDIMESVGYEMDDETGNGKAHASVHCRAFYFKEDNHYTSTLDVENMHETYHTYAVVWKPDGITAYVDDKEYFSYGDLTDKRTWPFDEAQNIILNLAMGGGWGGAQGMDESMTSQKMLIDYVRVYALE